MVYFTYVAAPRSGDSERLKAGQAAKEPRKQVSSRGEVGRDDTGGQ